MSRRGMMPFSVVDAVTTQTACPRTAVVGKS